MSLKKNCCTNKISKHSETYPICIVRLDRDKKNTELDFPFTCTSNINHLSVQCRSLSLEADVSSYPRIADKYLQSWLW